MRTLLFVIAISVTIVAFTVFIVVRAIELRRFERRLRELMLEEQSMFEVTPLPVVDPVPLHRRRSA